MEQERFIELLREKKLKVTGQRLLVLEIMAGRPGEHLTVEEIHALASVSHPEIGIATIYRTVQIFQELNLINKLSFDDGYARYELGEGTKTSSPRHHHAICRGCGKIISFEGDLLDTLEKALQERTGFRVIDHDVRCYGYCQECNRTS